ncbi:glycoside hydrolase family 47 protein [Durotheca rogersii]|uniref:glycoside hydrolase family 47 protein n=1 Tax=Durotheca rogersii TaxID=419775 RepID=UPI0022208073|nr:glycoside hydrolase family 47 protein [Durotheca rogersii]KAI5859806.1 glycoside hydrolase family 47 protein [Durotheca rogersii]
MFRLRRYRYYVFFAAIIVFLLYRASTNSEEWKSVSASIPLRKAPPKSPPPRGSEKPPAAGNDGTRFTHQDDDLSQKFLKGAPKEADVKIPNLKPTVAEEGVDKHGRLPTVTKGSNEGSKVVVYDKEGAAKTTTAPLIDIPDKNVGQGAKGAGKGENPDPKKVKPNAATTAIHWTKVPEHFPIPKGEIIPLPTGKPEAIPPVQHVFEKESASAREERRVRLAKVKAEMVRGWGGYITYAKGHDELSPISKKFRDPFCGWAATLVDALDTLWIMGMKDEFEEAVLEVEKIDFTTSSYRSEIPVFETTIRYLGGLVAAYDVSGGKAGGYNILLEKAVELAEILMGVFDTPNRMPVLYYNWKPAFASRPKRAQGSVSVAELGSLAMEFTRLAQLTKQDKYYDAVARITDAFYEWQERGTTIPGIFPEHVDASGCNRTAEAEIAAKEAEYNKVDEAVSGSSKRDDLGGEAVSGPGESPGGGFSDNAVSRRSVNKVSRFTNLASGDKDKCVPQGLAPGGWSTAEQYSMGGSQDSTYEYFPKQWLLLGGLEPKYKTLHTRVAAAVKKWLLYRPMVPDDRDILFSAKINTNGNPEVDASTEWEVTHLTCFIGGMFGMGGKIFNIPEDVEIGKRLADGCVWAYESTPSGIMPEGATVVPCAEANNCHWNETLYWQYLDPLYATRNQQIDEYQTKLKELKAEKAQKKEHTSDGVQKRAPPPVKMTTPNKDTLTQVARLEDALDINAGSRAAAAAAEGKADQAPLSEANDEAEFPELQRPISHEEYVKKKIDMDRLPPGFVSASSKHYILRPEAIESVWYMYRITGDTTWQDKGWKMFNAIVTHTQTTVGNSAINDVLSPTPDKSDEMESFWLAETLKYFYLLYSDPNVLSLDEWVFNTEAHPFKRPV